MAQDRKRFTLKDSDQMIMDVIDEFFDQHNIDFDLKELMKVEMTGENVPEMEQIEGEL